MRCRWSLSATFNSGRSPVLATRRKISSTLAVKQSSTPLLPKIARFSALTSAPPPVLMTRPLCSLNRAHSCASAVRKTPSPSWAKTSRIGLPKCACSWSSMSTKGRSRQAASRRPMVVLPVPIKPVRMIFLEAVSVIMRHFYSWVSRC